MPFGPPPNEEMNAKLRAERPHGAKDVPRWLREVFGGTFSRIVYIFRLIWEANKPLLFFAVFMTVFNGVKLPVETYIAANLLTKVVERFTDPTADIVGALVLQFGYGFVLGLMTTVNNVVNKTAGEIVTNHIKVKIMKKAKEVDLASFDDPNFYERLENANREADVRPVNIMNSVFELISYTITFVIYIVILFTLFKKLDWTAYTFFLIFVVISAATAAISFHFRKKNFLYMRHRSKDRRQMQYYSDLMVNKDVVKEIRLFDLSDIFIGRYQSVFVGYFKGLKSLISREAAWRIALSMCSAAVNGLMFWMIAVHVDQIGDYSVYTSALRNVSGCVSTLITTTAAIYEGSLFIDNMILFMNEKRTVVPLTDKPLSPARHCGHTIVFDHVSFSYPGSDRKVINDVDLTINAGETVVLVGLNGAGKTTLIKLLTRLYDPTEGRILLDGHDLREYDTTELYRIFGIIFQDFGKYAVSAADNIAFGEAAKPAKPGEISSAAEKSGADAFINALPKGYDTQLMKYFDADGTELSTGQWQKLSIARAFYSDSDILILDEPTASLDPIAEQEVFSRFDDLRKDKTTIFVSHRLSSAVMADRIVLLKNGAVAESGDHKTLMEAGGEYCRMFTVQASRYISREDERVLTDAPSGQ